MPDPDLFDWAARARRHDPDTSWSTARRIKVHAQAITVLRAYRIVGRELSDMDAYRLAGFPTGRTSHQRCSDLRDAGFIERIRRGRSPSGNSAFLCRITAKGLAFLASIEPRAGE